MRAPPPETNPDIDARAYNRLQQELIAFRSQRDRQIGQLIRLNSLSDALLVSIDPGEAAEAFAEAIVDVLDIGIGALWLVDPTLPEAARFAVCGMRVPRGAWARAGAPLLEQLPATPLRKALPLPPELKRLLSGPDLEDCLVCRCISRDGQLRGLLLAANCRAMAGMADAVWEESLEVLSLLAEKLAAHLDHCSDRQLIADQIRKLQSSEQRLAAVLKGTNEGWWDLDLIENTCFLSARWQQMMGHPEPRQQVRGEFWRERIHAEDRQQFEWLFHQVISGRTQILEMELRLQDYNEQYLPVLIRGTVIRLFDGTPRRFSGSMQDLSERKRYEAQVHRLAFYDPLTELPNRRLLQDQMLAISRKEGQCFGVLMLDLDDFKTINDSFGHSAGDQLLCVVSQRLQRCLGQQEMVARLGGDEFVILSELACGQDPAGVEPRLIQLGETIIQTIAEPIRLDVGTVHQGVSVGIALPNGSSCSGEKLMQQADLALFEAKASGRHSVRVFQDHMQQRVDRRSQVEIRLREGMRHNALQGAYQLQVNSERMAIGCEVLVRWVASQGLTLSPSEFIPVAQDTGLIHQLGEKMMLQVLQDLPAWEKAGLPADFRISINFSTPEFLHPDFVKQVLNRLNEAGVSGSRLRIEITEDSVLYDLATAAERMHMLMEHDIEFSLDDFGTGYSSFTYLRYLPVREVKIDQGFVRRFLQHPQDAAIVRAIIELGHSLNLRVVAEGVENHEQWLALRQAGCHLFQGFLFDRPSLEGERLLLERIRLLTAAPV
jgi:diguanylate cyclase (GGDEF)-like protein/PAS domain S-box-containing protein